MCKDRYRRRSTSTSSVSGSISSYSDSDVMDIGSDTTTLIDDDEEKIFNNLPQILDRYRKNIYLDIEFTTYLFQKLIMNVKLATQLLSRSVAKAIEFCDKI